MALAQASRAFTRGSQATQLTVLLHRVAHPVDLGVSGDGSVVDIDHDDLIVLVGGVLAHPVRVQNPQTLEPSTHPLLRDGLQVPLRFLLLHGS